MTIENIDSIVRTDPKLEDAYKHFWLIHVLKGHFIKEIHLICNRKTGMVFTLLTLLNSFLLYIYYSIASLKLIATHVLFLLSVMLYGIFHFQLLLNRDG